MSPPNRRQFLRATGAGVGLGLGLRGPLGLERGRGAGPGARRTPSATTRRRRRHQPPRSRSRQPDHRRLDLPGQSRSFLHSPVPRGVSRPVSTALEDVAARDSRRVRPPIWRMVWRPGNQGEVQRHSPSGLRRLARSRLARLVEAGARRQPRTGSHADGAQLGHPPRDGQPHLGDRHQDRPAVSRAHRRLHGKLGLERRQVGRSAWPIT